jgi:hypothetical protein
VPSWDWPLRPAKMRSSTEPPATSSP